MSKKKIREILSARWWQGVGVIVAIIALFWSMLFYEKDSTIFSEGDTPLPQPLRSSQFVVESGEELTVETPKIEASRVVFRDSARLVVPSKFREWEINADTLEVGKGVEIVAFGSDGKDGIPGSYGANANVDCQPGQGGIDDQEPRWRWRKRRKRWKGWQWRKSG